jgi:RecB family exonuclease
MLSVTAAAAGGGCALRVVLRSNWSTAVPQIPRGPAASFGTLVHECMELAGLAGSDPAGELEARLPEVMSAFTTGPDFARIRLKDLVDVATQRRATAILQRIPLLTNQPWQRRPSAQGGDHRPRLRGPEVPLRSPTMRLSGKADLVTEGRDGVTDIVDFKTGPVVDSEGELKKDYRRQLIAYAEILRELEPEKRVRAWLDNGERAEVDLSTEARAWFSAWLQDLHHSIPAPGHHDAMSLASPGSDCAFCDHRMACTAYLAMAVTWWNDPPDYRTPLDSWGTVIQDRTDEPGREIELRDAADRLVRILAVGERHNLPPDLTGAQIWFFGLEPVRRQRDRDGRWLQPRVLRDLTIEPGTSPAWSCTAIVG